jgi:glycosyltransferase involved in cell wall biosynthesis
VPKTSIIIPCRVESYEVSPGISVLKRTVQDVYEKATGDFEVIVVFDGPPYQELGDYPNLKTIHLPEWGGIKNALNVGAKESDGKYLFKIDAHCMMCYGFDEVLQESMEDNWVVMPRFYVLDAENWRWQDGRFYDYFMLPSPFAYRNGFVFQAGGHWPERTKEKLGIALDENMKLHGSCWYMTKDFYCNKLGGLDPTNGAGTWCGEDIEISLKTWLGPWGSRLMVNKRTWYAHMHRGGQRPREWSGPYKEALKSAVWTANYWMKNQWEERIHDIDWLIEKFWPIPTWADDWKELYKEYLNESD